jgi:hypothetical protein
LGVEIFNNATYREKNRRFGNAEIKIEEDMTK